MMSSSLAQVMACGATMMPLFSLVVKSGTARSISAASWKPPAAADHRARGGASGAPLGPSKLSEPLQKRCQVSLAQLRLSAAHEHADTTHPLTLLRRRGRRPCGRATDQRDECPSLHDRSS